jgi:hypothetical protein
MAPYESCDIYHGIRDLEIMNSTKRFAPEPSALSKVSDAGVLMSLWPPHRGWADLAVTYNLTHESSPINTTFACFQASIHKSEIQTAN